MGRKQSMTDTLPPQSNPYVGPRAFQRGEVLYGRDQEVMELLDLLIAERIVLLYSVSGAGKTSLIQAALLPQLEREGFKILPPMRVSLDPCEEADQSTEPATIQTTDSATNRYILSLLLSLDEALPEDQQRSTAELSALTLDEYLECCYSGAEGPEGIVLVFDQFEEILTVDPTDREAKAQFFAQVGAALRDRKRWALFAMREEFLAGLDPYLRPVPTRLSTTYRLELLGMNASKKAMLEPARAVSVEFTAAAADKLVDDLRTLRVQQPDGSMTVTLGDHVEPVQLQVVCRRLWDRLPAGATQIVEADVESVGDVDQALRAYYADRVAAIAAESGVPERAIRDWCDQQLITEQGIRGQVLQGHEESQGLDNQAIWPLVDAHLVRAESRRGATWFELAHDRLIEPVRADNADWREAHLHPLQRQAALWEEAGHPAGLLLRGETLAEAEAWAKSHQEELASVDREFLEACQEARALAERERRQSRRIRWLAVGATLFSIMAIVLAIVAGLQTRAAQTSAEAAAMAQSTAEGRLYVAQTAEALAAQEREKALSAANSEAEARQLAQGLQATLAVNLDILLALQTSAAPAATPTTVGTPDATSPPTSRETAQAMGGQATLQAIGTQVAGVQATSTAAAAAAAPVTPTSAAAVAATPTPAFLANNLEGFGRNQGQNGWKYLVEQGRKSGQWQEMRFGEFEGQPCWLSVTGEDYVRICADGELHPGVTTRVAYEWHPSVDRNVDIHLDAHMVDADCGGDGVEIEAFTVSENTGAIQRLGQFGVPAGSQDGITENLQTRMAPGILLYVTVDIYGDSGCDATYLEIEVD
jgi:hypothetical protein